MSARAVTSTPMALDPDAGLAHQWYGNYLTAMGRFDEAEEAMRRAHALDPFRIFARAVLG
jgi:tetratricopeptide (TPR) repeat protein